MPGGTAGMVNDRGKWYDDAAFGAAVPMKKTAA
jgi:hypothetical protein